MGAEEGWVGSDGKLSHCNRNFFYPETTTTSTTTSSSSSSFSSSFSSSTTTTTTDEPKVFMITPPPGIDWSKPTCPGARDCPEPPEMYCYKGHCSYMRNYWMLMEKHGGIELEEKDP